MEKKDFIYLMTIAVTALIVYIFLIIALAICLTSCSTVIIPQKTPQTYNSGSMVTKRLSMPAYTSEASNYLLPSYTLPCGELNFLHNSKI